MARALKVLEAGELDALDEDTGIPKAELREMLQAGLDELARGEGVVMDTAAWQRLRAEMGQRRIR